MYNLSNFIDEVKTEKVTYSIPEVNEVVINLKQLQRNFNIYRSGLKSSTRFMAVLKGDAYGHGIIPIAQELEKCKCDAFGVVRLIEAVSIRQAKIHTPILMLAPITSSQAPWLIRYNIMPMVDNESMVEILEKSAAEWGRTLKVHIKVNTGLNRYGLKPEETVEFIRCIQNKKRYPHIEIEGIYTHFKDAEYDPKFTDKQLKIFNTLLRKLEEENLRPPIAHVAGSAGMLDYPQSHYDMVRCGLALYGLEYKEGEKHLPKGVKALMSLKARIIKIQHIRKGSSAGYGAKFIAEKDSCLAIIGMGYGDGVSRGWKEVLIAGCRVPVVSYFMDGIMADITDLKESVKEFDEAVIVGEQGGEKISWEEACDNMSSQVDEQIQHITKRVPKRYYYK